MNRPRCLECGRVTNKDARRGLCGVCRRDPVVRKNYRMMPRGCWQDGAKEWTPHETTRLIRFVRAGFSDAKIALLMNRTYTGVSRKRRRMGLPTRWRQEA